MRCIPTCFDTCRLQKACLQMLFAYEGRIHICLPENHLAGPLSLCSLKVAELSVLPQECCPQASVSIVLRLSCCITDSMGRTSVGESEIRFSIPRSYAQARCSRYGATIRLIHSRRDAPDAFHICAQILLTEASESCAPTHGCETNCLHRLPLYPHMRMRRRIKPSEKHF